MLSKAKIKWIRSLEQKKFRTEYGLFCVEGHRSVEELLPLLNCRFLAATENWLQSHTKLPADDIQAVAAEELQRLSRLQTPQDVLAVFEMPTQRLSIEDLRGRLVLALDNVQDPGNLGTIIRIADWFGIEHLLCSKGTVDAFNPKTIQSCMGAIGRVKMHYLSLTETLPTLNHPVYGTFLEGESLYAQNTLPQEAVIVMGNEGNGISPEVEALVTQKIHIPNFPLGRVCVESLNVSMATAIVCSEFRRRALTK